MRSCFTPSTTESGTEPPLDVLDVFNILQRTVVFQINLRVPKRASLSGGLRTKRLENKSKTTIPKMKPKTGTAYAAFILCSAKIL